MTGWFTIQLATIYYVSKMISDVHKIRTRCMYSLHDDVIKWRHFPRYWPFVRGIHRSPVNSPHKGQWHRALMFSLICVWNKRLNKQSWGWWFETPSCSLWRHRNETTFLFQSRKRVFLLLAPQEVVILTTSSIASNENFVNMTFSFQGYGGYPIDWQRV